MSAFNNRLHIKEENGIVTNIDEIKAIISDFKGHFSDEEYRYVDSLITYLSTSEIKNRFELIDILNDYKYINKLNSNVEASDYLSTVLGLMVGIVSFKEENDETFYLYYYKSKKMKVLECMQKYDLANYVNTYMDTFKDTSKIISGYIDYLMNTLNFNPIPKKVELEDLNLKMSSQIKEFVERKRIDEYEIFMDSKNRIFIVAGTSIIRYNSKTDELYYLKSEDVFLNKLNENNVNFDDIHVLLPFEIDVNRLNKLIDNMDTLSSFDKRYLEAAMKTILIKNELVDNDAMDVLNRYIETLNKKVLDNTFILTKIEKEFLLRANAGNEGQKLEKKNNASGGYIIVMMEIGIIIAYILLYISLVK